MESTDNRKSQKKQKGESKERKSNGMVTIPYVKGVSEALSRVLRKHHISTPMRPHNTIKQLLVHPKDKVSKEDKTGVVYQIPCNACNLTYIGETGRKFGTRLKEHQKDVETMTQQVYTRSAKKTSEKQYNKSAITDHANIHNHLIDWNNSKVLERENNWKVRKIKESIWVRKEGVSMNRDEGGHQLSHLYDPILTSNKGRNG